MKLSSKAESIYSRIKGKTTKLGDIRKVAKEVKKDHDLAMELWSLVEFLPRQLAILIMDKKQLSQQVISQLCQDIQNHPINEQTQLIDWLMANQFMKDKQIIAMMETWENSPSALQRRIFWYYQARLRWTGKTGFSNTEDLLASIESRIAGEAPEVQWAMNFTAGQIGIHQPELRARCVAIGEKTGLYKDEKVPKNCTPNYLPEFIAIEAAKLQK